MWRERSNICACFNVQVYLKTNIFNCQPVYTANEDFWMGTNLTLCHFIISARMCVRRMQSNAGERRKLQNKKDFFGEWIKSEASLTIQTVPRNVSFCIRWASVRVQKKIPSSVGKFSLVFSPQRRAQSTPHFKDSFNRITQFEILSLNVSQFSGRIRCGAVAILLFILGIINSLIY